MPVGYERFSGDATTQIGTGPYTLKEFEVGKQSVHVRNEFYWDAGKPSFDEVHIIDFADADAMINALLADQIDIANDIPSASVETVNGTDGYKVLNSEGGGWLTISMAVDQEPFTDVRIRQAMRLIVDRDAMVEQVLAGYGRVANDLYGPLDAAYIGDELPQRTQDLDAAKALLAEAGASDLDDRPVRAQRHRRSAGDGPAVRRAGQGRRHHRQRPGHRRRHLLGRRVPQAHVRHRLLGHPQLPAAGGRPAASRPPRRSRTITGRRRARPSWRTTTPPSPRPTTPSAR